MAKNVKISLLGFKILNGNFNDDLSLNVETMINYFAQNLVKVLPDNPDIILFPEACDSYANFTPEQDRIYYKFRGEKILNYLCDAAKKNHCNIAYSATRNISDDEKYPFRNSTQIIGRDGKVIGVYDKNHIMVEENTQCDTAYGTEAKVIDSDIGKIACMICFDLNFNVLLEKYKTQKPDLILFSSWYHGGLKQQEWAYECGSYFASAIAGTQSRIINPFGEVIASTTNYNNFATGKVNLDCTLAHLSYNWNKFIEMKKKYGEGVTIHDPGYFGIALITCERDDMTVMDMIKEFDIELFDDYLERALKHRDANLVY